MHLSDTAHARQVRDDVLSGRIPADGAAAALSALWDRPAGGTWQPLDLDSDAQPHRLLSIDDWVTLYRHVGLVDHYRNIEDQRPTQPIRLYRGATDPGAAGMSWTPDRYTAWWYTAERPGSGSVWVADVEPGRLLAHYPWRFHADEWVVDPRGLTVVRHHDGWPTRLDSAPTSE